MTTPFNKLTAVKPFEQLTLPTKPLTNKALNISGHRFGNLTAIAPAPAPSTAQTTRSQHWHCLCTCGTWSVVAANSLRSGKTKSCGCTNPRKTKHGLCKDPAYTCWENMRQRCNNERNTNYRHYGGRGIQVCERWDDFALFLEDMGPRPSLQHSIERLDNDGHYEPANCVWATMKTQCNNRRPRQRSAA